MHRPLWLKIAAIVVGLAACDASTPRTAHPTSSASIPTTTTTSRPAAPTPSPTSAPTSNAPTTKAPASTAATPAFTGTIATVNAARLGSSYHPGCPVGPAALRVLHLSYWGFDDRPHVGAMVVNVSVTQAVVTVFATLFRARFPIRRMVTIDAYGADDPSSMAADNTSGFNCRPVPGSKPPRWSAHAYGEAIDVNTVENPYVADGVVQPPAGTGFLDRGNLGPGMAAPGTALNNAFAAVGWFWGGRWASPDYQHFSKTGG